MTDLHRIRMWAMGLAMEHTPDDADREATEIVAQWLVDWVMGDPGAAHEPVERKVPDWRSGYLYGAPLVDPVGAPPCDVEF